METKNMSPQDREFCQRQERSTIVGDNGVCRHITMKADLPEKSGTDEQPKSER